MYCKHCGERIDNNSTFCSYCGNNLASPVQGTSNGTSIDDIIRNATWEGTESNQLTSSDSVRLAQIQEESRIRAQKEEEERLRKEELQIVEFELAARCYQIAEYDEALEIWIRYGSKGNLVALFNLFLCYGNGYGISRDKNLTLSCLRKSAEFGFHPAIHNLAVLFCENGDYETAYHLWSDLYAVHDNGQLIPKMILTQTAQECQGNLSDGYENEPLDVYWKLSNLSNLIVLNEKIKSIPHKTFCFTSEDHSNAYLRDVCRSEFASIAKKLFDTSFFGVLLKKDNRDEIVEQCKNEITKIKFYYNKPFYYNSQGNKFVDDLY